MDSKRSGRLREYKRLHDSLKKSRNRNNEPLVYHSPWTDAKIADQPEEFMDWIENIMWSSGLSALERYCVRKYYGLDGNGINDIMELAEHVSHIYGEIPFSNIFVLIDNVVGRLRNEAFELTPKEPAPDDNIETLKLSTGTFNALKWHYVSIAKIVETLTSTPEKVMSVRNLGTVRYNELICKLGEHGHITPDQVQKFLKEEPR